MSGSVVDLTFENLTTGTSPAEVFGVTFVVPLTSLLFILLTTSLPFIAYRLHAFLETIVINVSLLLSLTVLDSHLLTVLSIFTVLISIVGCFLIKKEFKVQLKNFNSQSFLKNLKLDAFGSPKQIIEDVIRDYRGHLLLATAICILAVDFNIFSLKYAKTETYGWSVMDGGVGCFVLIHGVCSSHARKVHYKGLRKSLVSSVPLFALGFVRLIAVSAVGYHTSVPEYGTHWNFFFTLAVTKAVCSCALNLHHALNPGLLAFVALIIQQWLLSVRGVTSFILSDDRSSFLRANKEGICSLPGFIAIYFEGVQLGLLLWKSRVKIWGWISLFFMLCGIGICGWCAMIIFHDYLQPVSRRMANLPYCIWVLSLTSLQLALHLAIHLIIILVSSCLKDKARLQLLSSKDCLLWKAINYNGLFYFLISNLITGIVNLSVDTYTSPDSQSFFILVLYLAILSTVAAVMYKFSIQVKCR